MKKTKNFVLTFLALINLIGCDGGMQSARMPANDSSIDLTNIDSWEALRYRRYRPTVQNISVSVNANSSVTVALIGSDPQNDPLTYKVSTPPSHGSVTISGDKATYTPSPNYSGSDSFQYTASDGTYNSLAATVSIKVISTAPSPVTLGSASLTWDANTDDIAYYKVYSGTDPNNLTLLESNVAKSSAPSYVAKDLQSGKTYYFAVTAVNSSGLESDKSNIASKTLFSN